MPLRCAIGDHISAQMQYVGTNGKRVDVSIPLLPGGKTELAARNRGFGSAYTYDLSTASVHLLLVAPADPALTVGFGHFALVDVLGCGRNVAKPGGRTVAVWIRVEPGQHSMIGDPLISHQMMKQGP